MRLLCEICPDSVKILIRGPKKVCKILVVWNLKAGGDFFREFFVSFFVSFTHKKTHELVTISHEKSHELLSPHTWFVNYLDSRITHVFQNQNLWSEIETHKKVMFISFKIVSPSRSSSTPSAITSVQSSDDESSQFDVPSYTQPSTSFACCIEIERPQFQAQSKMLESRSLPNKKSNLSSWFITFPDCTSENMQTST